MATCASPGDADDDDDDDDDDQQVRVVEDANITPTIRYAVQCETTVEDLQAEARYCEDREDREDRDPPAVGSIIMVK